MDEENTKLRNKLMEQNELIDLLHLTVHTTTKECEYNIKCEVEKKDSAMLFKVKLCWQLWCHNNLSHQIQVKELSLSRKTTKS